MITVFTPAYDREKLLGRVYDSLKVQTFRDFEWLIVDDGSSDGTRNLVKEWIAEGLMPIRYIWKENGGKHTALNLGIKEAAGIYFVVADSDDWLLPDGLRILHEEWQQIEFPEKYSGVCGLFEYPDGRVVGCEFPEDRLNSNAIDLRQKFQVTGDKMGMNRLAVLREFPFPENFPKGYVPESLVWNRIAQVYDTRFINRRIAVKEYQVGGITDRASLNSWRNPQAYRLRALELLDGERTLSAGSTLRAAVAVAKGSLVAGTIPWDARRAIHRLLIILMLPGASLLLLRDWRRSKKQ